MLHVLSLALRSNIMTVPLADKRVELESNDRHVDEEQGDPVCEALLRPCLFLPQSSEVVLLAGQYLELARVLDRR